MLPGLADLDAVTVAQSVVHIVGDHLVRQAARLAPCAKLDLQCPDGTEDEQCDLGIAVQALVRWAQTGEGDAWEAWTVAQSVCVALYSQAGVWEASDTGELGLGDAPNIDETAIGVVLLATMARRCIVQGEDVAPRWLAALAGITKRRVNQLTDNGTLKRRRSTGPRGRTAIPATAAWRLLVSRIVGNDTARTLNTMDVTVKYCAVGGENYLAIGGVNERLVTMAKENAWERAGNAWIARADTFSR